MSGNKYLIVKGKEGLGNRIFSALTGIMYARLSGRKLIIDWSDHIYSNNGANVFNKLFDCPMCCLIDDIPEADSVNPVVWRGNLQRSVYEMDIMDGSITNNIESRLKFSIDPRNMQYDEEILIMWSPSNRIGQLRDHINRENKEFGSLSTDDISRKLLRENLILRPAIRKRVDKFVTERFKGETVGIHVRFTDKTVLLPKILTKLHELLKRMPNLQIFLATDNLEIKKTFEQKYRNVITTPHWYSKAGIPIHGNQDCPDPTESCIEALIDLYLLAECDYLIIDSTSSFSYMTKLLSEAPDSCIFDVKPREKPLLRLQKFNKRLRTKLRSLIFGPALLGRFLRTH